MVVHTGEEATNRLEIDHLVSSCSQYYFLLNALETGATGVDFRQNPVPPSPISLYNSPVDIVKSWAPSSPWGLNISSPITQVHHGIYFLRQQKKSILPIPMTVQFYAAINESIHNSSSPFGILYLPDLHTSWASPTLPPWTVCVSSHCHEAAVYVDQNLQSQRQLFLQLPSVTVSAVLFCVANYTKERSLKVLYM